MQQNQFENNYSKNLEGTNNFQDAGSRSGETGGEPIGGEITPNCVCRCTCCPCCPCNPGEEDYLQYIDWKYNPVTSWESQFFISIKYVKNRKIEIEYTSNSHVNCWQIQSLRNRVEVSSWNWERLGFCIKRPGTLTKRFHQTNPPPQCSCSRWRRWLRNVTTKHSSSMVKIYIDEICQLVSVNNLERSQTNLKTSFH